MNQLKSSMQKYDYVTIITMLFKEPQRNQYQPEVRKTVPWWTKEIKIRH